MAAIGYDNVGEAFAAHLGDLFEPGRLFMDEGRLLPHTYLGELLHVTVTGPGRGDLRKRLASLVEQLHFEGDENCRELVHVSFFENMDHLTDQQVDQMRGVLSARMNRVMDEAFAQLGYPLR